MASSVFVCVEGVYIGSFAPDDIYPIIHYALAFCVCFAVVTCICSFQMHLCVCLSTRVIVNSILELELTRVEQIFLYKAGLLLNTDIALPFLKIKKYCQKLCFYSGFTLGWYRQPIRSSH